MNVHERSQKTLMKDRSSILIWSFISCFFSCLKAKKFIPKEQYEIQKVEYTKRELQKLSQHILSNQEVMDKFDESND
jgi:hypothetical protein